MPAYPLQPDSLPQPLAFQPDSTDFFSNAYLPSFTTRLPINSHQLQDGSLSSDSIEGREVDQSAKSNKQMYILRCRSGERKEERVVIFCWPILMKKEFIQYISTKEVKSHTKLPCLWRSMGLSDLSMTSWRSSELSSAIALNVFRLSLICPWSWTEAGVWYKGRLFQSSQADSFLQLTDGDGLTGLPNTGDSFSPTFEVRVRALESTGSEVRSNNRPSNPSATGPEQNTYPIPSPNPFSKANQTASRLWPSSDQIPPLVSSRSSSLQERELELRAGKQLFKT